MAATLPARASPFLNLLCNGYRHLPAKPSSIRPLASLHRRHFQLLQNSPDFRVIRRARTIPTPPVQVEAHRIGALNELKKEMMMVGGD